MSNTISPPNPESIDLYSQDVWQYPTTAVALDDNNPAVQARAEYEHGLYVDALATPDTAPDAVEAAQPQPVQEGRAAEYVPAPGEVHGYATNTGSVVDPAHAEAVLAATAELVDIYAALDTAEATSATPEYAVDAAHRAAAYGDHLGKIRDRALLDWGAEGEV